MAQLSCNSWLLLQLMCSVLQGFYWPAANLASKKYFIDVDIVTL